MAFDKDSAQKKPAIDEDEIFKSLSHGIRRDIIRLIGSNQELTFTEIKTKIGSLDSPSLSYHLKSLQALLESKDNKYFLTDIGISAFKLLLKTDQSQKISKYKKRFKYAYVATVLCWIAVQTLIPLMIIFTGLGFPPYYFLIVIILNIIAPINYIIIWKLQKVEVTWQNSFS